MAWQSERLILDLLFHFGDEFTFEYIPHKERNESARDVKSRTPQTQRQIVHREQVSITGEVNYIIGQAQNYDARVVVFGPLVFFSTETGDAWMLDPEDGLALCLARGGEARRFTITETVTNFGIEWKANYRIDGDEFIVAERSGRTRSILVPE